MSNIKVFLRETEQQNIASVVLVKDVKLEQTRAQVQKRVKEAK